MDPFIYDDILGCIFGFLEISEWFNVKLVCRQWGKIGNKIFNPSLIKDVFVRIKTVEGIKFLLRDPRVDPSAKKNCAIRYASWKGYLGVVKILLQDSRTDPSSQENAAIRWASERGHLEVVKVLLQDKRVNPSAWYNWSIHRASRGNHLEVIKLLSQDSRVFNILTDKQRKKYNF